ncbi:hypothetical protein LAUMK13_04981 [Mycobacterium innocens]|uniref:Uncharacterized protein n=2 Tax=Mycobacterium innocens TaxID=2341083 RepID=A0A498QGI3_9MYCO|nr:hypothetical protein LAUMK13_04981 [Mycobacterium innocens]
MFLDDLIDPPDVEPMVKFERVYLAAMGHLDSGRTQLAEMAESLLKAARIFDECPSLGKELDFDSELDHPMDGAAFLRRQARIFPLDDEPEMTLSVDMETLDLLRQIVVAAVHNVVAKNETSDADTASSRGS